MFSIMCNEAIADRGAVAIIDQIATSIAGFGRTQQAK